MDIARHFDRASIERANAGAILAAASEARQCEKRNQSTRDVLRLTHKRSTLEGPLVG